MQYFYYISSDTVCKCSLWDWFREPLAELFQKEEIEQEKPPHNCNIREHELLLKLMYALSQCLCPLFSWALHACSNYNLGCDDQLDQVNPSFLYDLTRWFLVQEVIQTCESVVLWKVRTGEKKSLPFMCFSVVND